MTAPVLRNVRRRKAYRANQERQRAELEDELRWAEGVLDRAKLTPHTYPDAVERVERYAVRLREKLSHFG